MIATDDPEDSIVERQFDFTHPGRTANSVACLAADLAGIGSRLSPFP